MNSYRDHPREFGRATSNRVAMPYDVANAIGTDERRMHVRAYNHWVSLLGGREFPSIEDLEPATVEDFADHSVLLDFTLGRDNPTIAYVGTAIRRECEIAEDVQSIADVQSRSLLSRLTDHYLQIIANRAPVGFEADFENSLGEMLCYRGILMPFSSDGDAIDFIYGVINWKRDESAETELADIISPFESANDDDVLELSDDWTPGHHAVGDLGGQLVAARESAELVKAGEARTRSALYEALSLAYDFALATEAQPDNYARLLEQEGISVQPRAPMTPVVKLVFGVDYDKSRVTEFAAALSFARRENLGSGAFRQFIESQPGGLKALVAAERHARRPDKLDEDHARSEAALKRLRNAAPLSLANGPADQEFALVLTRRGSDGTHQPIAFVADPALIDRAIRRAS